MDPTPELVELREQLTALYNSAGDPPFEQLAAHAKLQGLSLPKQTTSSLLKEDSAAVPRWRTVKTFILACQHYAAKHQPPVPLAPADVDLDHWEELYQRANPTPDTSTSTPSEPVDDSPDHHRLSRTNIKISGPVGAINVGDNQHNEQTTFYSIRHRFTWRRLWRR